MRRAARLGLASVLVAGALLACGARTGLLAPETQPVADAAPDHAKDAAGEDVGIDVPIPPIDASKKDANQNDCPDADSTLVYVVTVNRELLSFYPPSATFKVIGLLACPAQGGATPFSMAVDRTGVAYVLYSDGELFKVSTADASCATTTFTAQSPFQNFGMGFATLGGGPDERLYIASSGTPGLGYVDVQNNYQLGYIGPLDPPVSGTELTGTGDGRLYGFFANPQGGSGSAVAEINKDTAKIVGIDYLPTVNQGQGWAFAYWGGYFWFFTTPGGQQTVRYDPATKTAKVVASYSSSIVGAGVSTCAPQ